VCVRERELVESSGDTVMGMESLLRETFRKTLPRRIGAVLAEEEYGADV